jgi:methyl-accepting chemotaxis protein
MSLCARQEKNAVSSNRFHIASDATDLLDATASMVASGAILGSAPVNLIVADAKRRIQYLNAASARALKSIDRYLPRPGEDLRGQLLDVFLTSAAGDTEVRPIDGQPREILVDLGPEKLSWRIAHVRDVENNGEGFVAVWEIVTTKFAEEKHRTDIAAGAEAVSRMLQAISKTTTVEETAGAALEEVRKTFRWSYGTYWTVDPEDNRMKFVLESGSCPEEFRRATRESAFKEGQGLIGGCWKSRELTVVPDMGKTTTPRAPAALRGGVKTGVAIPLVSDGRVMGVIDFYVLEQIEVSQERANALRTVSSLVSAALLKIRNAGQIAEMAQQVASAAEEFSANSGQMSANAEETSVQSRVVASVAERVNSNLQTVANGSRDVGASIQEIATNANEAARVAASAVVAVEDSNRTVSRLGDSSAEIGQVVKIITTIAQQTNLLALNATIEAARAGEAGKGFAVVANEVKQLAKQTAQATEDIGRKIANIQGESSGAVKAIGQIGSIIKTVNDISSAIAVAVQKQTLTTDEMSRNVGEAARGSEEISRNISGVSEAAQNTASGATESRKAAKDLADLATRLQGLVTRQH